MLLPKLVTCIALGLAASCSLPTMDAVRDLAAIHTQTDWQPQTPAHLSVPPAFYYGNPAARASGDGIYAVEDHRGLELAIIEQINGVDANDPAYAIEVCAWMLMELTQDEHREARIAATHVLLRLAGTWAQTENVTWSAAQEGASFELAVGALNAATDHASFIAAVEQLQLTQFPDVLSGIRVLTALGRLAHRFGLGSGDGDTVVLSAALGIVIQSFEVCEGTPDPRVADACQISLNFLHNKARRS
jgi:hypothetical protein